MKIGNAAWVVLFLAPRVGSQAEDAEKLYNQMVEKVAAADSLQIAFQGDAKSNGAVRKTMEGKVLIQSPNSLYIKIDGKNQGKPESTLLVCDGKNLKVGDRPPRAAPEDASDNYRAILLTTGLCTYLSTAAVRKATQENKEFKLGKKEAVGGAQAQAVEYTIDLGKPELRLTTSVWIDLKASLPVKRVTTLKTAAEELVCSEILGAIKLDEKIDPKIFSVPK